MTTDFWIWMLGDLSTDWMFWVCVGCVILLILYGLRGGERDE